MKDLLPSTPQAIGPPQAVRVVILSIFQVKWHS